MKIFVCIKQVPDTETKIKINSDKTGIDTAGVKWVMNPYDEYAVEEAVKLKEKNPGATVFAVTVGPKPRAADVLRTALAMGADEGILVNAPEGIDPFSTAKALAETIQAEGGAQLILTGKLAIDDNASSVGQMLAENLNAPHMTVVSKLSYEGEKITVERDIEGGAKEVAQLMLPAVIGANKGLNMPRYASLPGIMKAKKKVLKEIDFSALDAKTKMVNFSLPAEKPPVKIIPGDSAQQVSSLVQLLRDEAKVL
ncbi:MAG: electron transfer flavoprotein subunit beta/FixA family protein [Bdellovibrionaceae bacterium]|nr:electron transfer flavoprotein subunit beta/FixA family protein [Pseudobdellovibrionaceae bacterium]